MNQKQSHRTLLPRDVLAFFGAHNLSNFLEPERFVLSPIEIFLHDKWNPRTTQYDGDISLLQFEEDSIHFNKFVQPICLWNSKSEPILTNGIVTGWGQDEDPTKKFKNEPKAIKVRIQSNDECLPGESELAGISSTTTFCAGLKDGFGVCHGDSGGGLFIKIDGVYHLKGIVSSSLLKNDGCDVTKNAVYTNVVKLAGWIEKIIKSSMVSSAMLVLTTSVQPHDHGRRHFFYGNELLNELTVFFITVVTNIFCTFKKQASGMMVMRHASMSSGQFYNYCLINQTIDNEEYVLESGLDYIVDRFDIRDNRKVKFLPKNIG